MWPSNKLLTIITGLTVATCVVWSRLLTCFDKTHARFPSKRNARNASDCIWMETGLHAGCHVILSLHEFAVVVVVVVVKFK